MADKKALTWTELRVGVVVIVSLIILAVHDPVHRRRGRLALRPEVHDEGD